jgi:TATA-box binding protein (TBP) (component of TFIID and TFIIIB)
MSSIEDYVARIEGTCGAEKDLIVIFKYKRRDEAIDRILKKAQLKNSLSGIIFELTFQKVSFRVYKSGKAIFRGIKDRKQLNEVLEGLLLS